jgi:hypothetical protein
MITGLAPVGVADSPKRCLFVIMTSVLRGQH